MVLILLDRFAADRITGIRHRAADINALTELIHPRDETDAGRIRVEVAAGGQRQRPIVEEGDAEALTLAQVAAVEIEVQFKAGRIAGAIPEQIGWQRDRRAGDFARIGGVGIIRLCDDLLGIPTHRIALVEQVEQGGVSRPRRFHGGMSIHAGKGDAVVMARVQVFVKIGQREILRRAFHRSGVHAEVGKGQALGGIRDPAHRHAEKVSIHPVFRAGVGPVAFLRRAIVDGGLVVRTEPAGPGLRCRVGRQRFPVILDIHLQRHHHLSQVADALGLPGFLPRLGEDGKRMAARIAMMAMTTSSSIRVKPVTLRNSV